MRIRRSASRILGSAYSAPAAPPPDAPAPFELPTLPLTPPPPPSLVPCSAAPLESSGGGGFARPVTASGKLCEFSCEPLSLPLPWDLMDGLYLSDTQEDDLMEGYYVPWRPSLLFSVSMTAASAKKETLAVVAAGEDSAQPRRESAKKVPKKAAVRKGKETMGSEAKKNAKVKKEDGVGGAARVWKCKKNDGKKWHCGRDVDHPNSLCDYHFARKRSHLNPGFELASAVESEVAAPVSAPASKRSASSKPRKKKKSGNDFNATEGIYYYTGFSFRSKRHWRSSGMNESVPAVPGKQEAEEELPKGDDSPPNQAQLAGDETNRAADGDDVSICDDIARIAGGGEESSDDDDRIGTSGLNMNGNGDTRASNGDSKRKNPWKRWRKPVKERSLKSLM